MRQSHRTIMMWGALLLMFYIIYVVVSNKGAEVQEATFSEFLDEVDSNSQAIGTVDIHNESEFVWTTDNKLRKRAVGKLTDDTIRHLRDKDIK
ncbi:MAG: hypothetical protein EOO40_12295, partial [Deltaproteobacteria bacterium]